LRHKYLLGFYWKLPGIKKPGFSRGAKVSDGGDLAILISERDCENKE